MKKLLSALMILTFCTGLTVCQASDLTKNTEDNKENSISDEKSDSKDGFVIYLNEKRTEETENSEDSFNEEWLEKEQSNDEDVIRIIRKTDIGLQEYYLVDGNVVRIEDIDCKDPISKTTDTK